MKKYLLLFSISFLLFQNAITGQASVESDVIKNQSLSEVCIMGVLHFVSKNNSVSQKYTSVQDPKSQKEIKDLVQRLKKFRPTKIAVERPYKSNIELNEAYQSYLKGEYQLSDEETDQIAFRLAKELGHEKLYLVYSQVNFDFET